MRNAKIIIDTFQNIWYGIDTETHRVFLKINTVSYTHLDVYKRQVQNGAGTFRPAAGGGALHPPGDGALQGPGGGTERPQRADPAGQRVPGLHSGRFLHLHDFGGHRGGIQKLSLIHISLAAAATV